MSDVEEYEVDPSTEACFCPQCGTHNEPVAVDGLDIFHCSECDEVWAASYIGDRVEDVDGFTCPCCLSAQRAPLRSPTRLEYICPSCRSRFDSEVLRPERGYTPERKEQAGIDDDPHPGDRENYCPECSEIAEVRARFGDHERARCGECGSTWKCEPRT